MAMTDEETEGLKAYVLREAKETGDVSFTEALEALSRFNASHFDAKDHEHARYSIPADRRRDDDIRLTAFIGKAVRIESESAELREAVKTLREAIVYVATEERGDTKVPCDEPECIDKFCLAMRATEHLK